MRTGIRCVAVAVAVLLVQPALSGAVTLMVNGDTPSIRWQRQVDRYYRMPTWPGLVRLYFDPELDDNGRIGFPIDGSPPEIDVRTTGQSSAAVSWTLRHELGHGTIIWARTVGGWTPADDRAAAARLRVPVEGSTKWGLDLDELLADAYAVCTFRQSERRWRLQLRKFLYETVGKPYALRSTAQVRWLCPRLRAAIRRATPLHSDDWILRHANAVAGP